MTFEEYQRRTSLTAKYPKNRALDYLVAGLVSEAGEIAGKHKKHIRDGAWRVHEVAAEIGDVLWYLSELCNELGIKLDVIAIENLAKLRDRAERDVIGGSGDNR